MTSYIRDFMTLGAHQQATVGDIKMSTIPADHMGWLLCDGREVSKKDFYFLFNTIGYAYGSNMSNADIFKLPNAAGRVPGIINPDGNDLYENLHHWQLGDVSGEEYHTLTLPEIPSHNHSWSGDVSGGADGITDTSGAHIHSINDPGHNHSYFNEANDQTITNLGGETAADQVDVSQTTGSSTTGITINSNGAHAHHIHSAGEDRPHNNIQPTIFVGNMFIYSGKPRQGTYPLSIAPKYSFY